MISDKLSVSDLSQDEIDRLYEYIDSLIAMIQEDIQNKESGEFYSQASSTHCNSVQWHRLCSKEIACMWQSLEPSVMLRAYTLAETTYLSLMHWLSLQGQTILLNLVCSMGFIAYQKIIVYYLCLNYVQLPYCLKTNILKLK